MTHREEAQRHMRRAGAGMSRPGHISSGLMKRGAVQLVGIFVDKSRERMFKMRLGTQRTA